MSLCKYKHIFGREGEGVHAARFMGMAAVDVGLTVGAALVLHKVFRWPFVLTLVALCALGLVMHRVFCVNTTLTNLVFGKV